MVIEVVYKGYGLTCCTAYIIQNCQRGTSIIFLPAMAKWSGNVLGLSVYFVNVVI